MTDQDQEEKAFTLRLPRPMHSQLRHLAFDQETSMNALIIDAIAAKYPAAGQPGTGHGRGTAAVG